jgi:nucleoid DNA-binding protein
MATSSDIIQRIAWRLPISIEDMSRFADELELLVSDALASGDDVELMTFGTISRRGGERIFSPHASLLKDRPESVDDA